MPTNIVPPFRPEAERAARTAIGHTLTDHGGPKISAPRAVAMFCGAVPNQANLATALRDIVEGGYLDGLAAYGVGRGKFIDTVNGPTFAPGGVTLTDGQMQAIARSIQGADIVCIYLPPGVNISYGQSLSCQGFCGYHGAAGGVAYCVLPDTGCQACHGGFDSFSALTMVTSHELAEACTDPYGNGWYEDATGEENADICAWVPVSYGQWTVQPYWTNESGCTAGTFAPGPVPVPGPPSGDGLTDAQVQAVQAMIDASIAKLSLSYQGGS
jgi:hypothetical protein